MRVYDLSENPRKGIIDSLKYLHAEAWKLGDLVLCDKLKDAIEHADAEISFLEGVESDSIFYTRRAEERPEV